MEKKKVVSTKKTSLTFFKLSEASLYLKEKLRLMHLRIKMVSVNKSFSMVMEIYKSEKEVNRKSTRSSFHST